MFLFKAKLRILLLKLLYINRLGYYTIVKFECTGGHSIMLALCLSADC